jgi:hypothetical protein
MRTKNNWTTALGATALLAVAVQLNPQEVTAADHTDSPATQGDAAADIGDFYAWHIPNGDEPGTVVAVVTFNPFLTAADYDPDVLYGIHIDNTATIAENNDIYDNNNDNESDIDIYIRFGANTAGDWFAQYNGVPGADEDPLVGPVDEVVTSGSATVTCGTFDDPFFFDFDGFSMTVANLLDDADPLDLAFTPEANNDNDTFAGANINACVVEVDAALIADGNADNFLQLWSTTAVAP